MGIVFIPWIYEWYDHDGIHKCECYSKCICILNPVFILVTLLRYISIYIFCFVLASLKFNVNLAVQTKLNMLRHYGFHSFPVVD